MPTYEYKCPKCGTEFEAFQKITSKPGAMCPSCGAKATRQMSLGAGLVFKGSGFYLTDYGRSGQSARKDGESATGGEKSGSEKSGGEKAAGEKAGGEKAGGEKAGADKPAAAKSAESKPKHKKKDD